MKKTPKMKKTSKTLKTLKRRNRNEENEENTENTENRKQFRQILRTKNPTRPKNLFENFDRKNGRKKVGGIFVRLEGRNHRKLQCSTEEDFSRFYHFCHFTLEVA
jgi:hypothetical protein